MSGNIFTDPLKTAAGITEDAAEEFSDHVGDSAPSVFRKLLDALSEYQFSGEFSFGLKKRQ